MAPIIFTKKILSAADQHNRCHSDRNIENHFESLKFLLHETYSIVRKILSIHNLYVQVKQAKNLRSKNYQEPLLINQLAFWGIQKGFDLK